MLIRTTRESPMERFVNQQNIEVTGSYSTIHQRA